MIAAGFCVMRQGKGPQTPGGARKWQVSDQGGIWPKWRRDGKELFIGSQSLRKLELDARREIGAIVRSGKLVSAFTAVFEDDWKTAATGQEADR